MPTFLRAGLALLVVPIAIVACYSGDATSPTSTIPPTTTPPAATGPTFHKDVEPILQAHCQSCHVAGGLAPFALTTFDDARVRAGGIVGETGARRMPPWGALDTSECKPTHGWNKDARLSEADIATLAAWSSGGTVEGDPKDAPAPRTPPRMDLPNASFELTPKQPFVTGGDNDQFRCFVLDDPRLAAGAYINGVHVIPGNATVVHHAVVVTDPMGLTAALAGPDGSFECSSATVGGANSVVLAVWTPGYLPIELPANIAMPVAPGSKIVMQIHYSPGGRVGEVDSTRVQLRLATTKPEYLLYTAAFGNVATAMANGDGLQPGPNDRSAIPEFRIPANTSGHTESMRITVPAVGSPPLKLHLYGVMAHEHLAGVDVKVDLQKVGSADRTCLLQDRWDFHWQRMYSYAAAVEDLPTLDPGDKILLRCTYDNTMDNHRLRAELVARRHTATSDIYLGEQTLDEMCLVIPQLLVKNP